VEKKAGFSIGRNGLCIMLSSAAPSWNDALVYLLKGKLSILKLTFLVCWNHLYKWVPTLQRTTMMNVLRRIRNTWHENEFLASADLNVGLRRKWRLKKLWEKASWNKSISVAVKKNMQSECGGIREFKLVSSFFVYGLETNNARTILELFFFMLRS